MRKQTNLVQSWCELVWMLFQLKVIDEKEVGKLIEERNKILDLKQKLSGRQYFW